MQTLQAHRAMPRNPRLHVPGGLYHAILRGNHRQVIFHDDDDCRTFEEILRAALHRYGGRLHAYCWMPNHVHLAVQVGEPPLGRLMHLLASRYSRWKQRRIPTTGHLFERRYRAKLVAADRYLLALVRYIHRNPVRAGLVADAADYAWSSHRAYLGLLPGGELVMAPTLDMFSNDSRVAAIAAYRSFIADTEREDDLPNIHPTGRQNQPDSLSPRPPDSHEMVVPRPLEDIVVEVAREYGVDIAHLTSGRRLPALVRARAEITRRALIEGAATLSQVSARLRRAPSSLSELLTRYQAH